MKEVIIFEVFVSNLKMNMSYIVEFRRRRVIYPLLAFALGIAAIYHLAALISPSSFPSSPVWRHSLFLLLDTVALLLSARRWIWLWIPFTMFTMQQLISHGFRAYDWWTLYHRVDTISIILIVFMPLVCAFLFYDFRFRVRQ